jgi:hypothetical protein
LTEADHPRQKYPGPATAQHAFQGTKQKIYPYARLFVCLCSIFLYTQQFFSYMMAVSFFYLVEERTQKIQYTSHMFVIHTCNILISVGRVVGGLAEFFIVFVFVKIFFFFFLGLQSGDFFLYFDSHSQFSSDFFAQ